MSSSMKEYLASKYMSGPKADAILARSTQPPKKKKRKALESESSTSSLIKDDDGGWGKEKEEDEFANEDMVIEQDRSFKKKKSDRWQTVREPTPPPQPDEQPMVVDTEGVGTSTGMPLTGGLLTSAQLRQTKAPPPTKLSKEARREEEETVYRDASGRKIDTKAARAEASRVKREKEEMEAKKMEWGKGLVQREEEERRKLEEEKERNRPLARHVDDADLNTDLKAQERWNDPAAAFLTKKRSKGPKKPEYTGPPPPPNRFGMKPGYRWDGVDRGNGFEKKLFQRANERTRRGLEAYEWSVDEM